MPSVVWTFWTLGVWEKRGVICVDYGVWGARVPSAGFGGMGVGGV